ncbi:MAG: maleylpyruvate isomerase N-terminal domain-containing protein [Chloroflexota bacterium]
MDDRTGTLVAELVAARDEFLAALDAVNPERLTRPGLVGEWSARELVAHLGYWSGHAVEVIQAAERGATETFGEGQPGVDAINATVARVARETDLATAQARERSSVEVLVERLRTLDPLLLDLPLPDGATVEQGLREDGAEHYREHTAELRGATGR